MMDMSPNIAELATALSKAQGQMVGASKSAANLFFKSKYADLESVWDACRKPLSENGLAILQSPHTDLVEGSLRVSVQTLLTHTSGQWISDTMTVSAKEDSPQALGSCVTYLRRYALQSFAGIAPTEDDGEAAEGRANGRAQPVERTPEVPPGFVDWVRDLESVADEGEIRLREAWTKSPAVLRHHLTKTNPSLWVTLKAKAAKVTTA
jgi:ERF superfamily